MSDLLHTHTTIGRVDDCGACAQVDADFAATALAYDPLGDLSPAEAAERSSLANPAHVLTFETYRGSLLISA